MPVRPRSREPALQQEVWYRGGDVRQGSPVWIAASRAYAEFFAGEGGEPGPVLQCVARGNLLDLAAVGIDVDEEKLAEFLPPDVVSVAIDTAFMSGEMYEWAQRSVSRLRKLGYDGVIVMQWHHRYPDPTPQRTAYIFDAQNVECVPARARAVADRYEPHLEAAALPPLRRVGWTDNEAGRYSTATIGACFLNVNWSEMRFVEGKTVFAYRVSIKPDAAADWVEFLVPDFDEQGRHTSLDAVKALAAARARELGCKRRHRRHEYDEEWLAELEREVLEQIESGQRQYEQEEEFRRRWGSTRPPYTRLVTTGYLPDYFAQHYLGRDASRRELQRAVGVVLGRLERAGRIESMTIEGERYWSVRHEKS